MKSIFNDLARPLVLGLFIAMHALVSCAQAPADKSYLPRKIKTGAENLAAYLPLLEDKEVAIVSNQTAVINNVHIVDTLLQLGVNITKVFVPEHGFRGVADAGEPVVNARDKQTKLPLVSLYGKNKKPKPSDLIDVQLMVFDIQDVGVRFYTYISTLYYIMQTCAEFDIPLVVLDRPNPNGFYVDGPVLDTNFTSFVGVVPIALVHGLTVGELAKMINGEGWLKTEKPCDLTVIKCQEYTHKDKYELTIFPSPNLKNMEAVYLYPSTALFEGTVVSEGRGTDRPFLFVGHPKYSNKSFDFTPLPRVGAKFPKFNGVKCYGLDLSAAANADLGKIDFQYIAHFYQDLKLGEAFFLQNNFIDLLAGTDALRKGLIEGKSIAEIEAGWQAELNLYKQLRKRYLLYPDFD